MVLVAKCLLRGLDQQGSECSSSGVLSSHQTLRCLNVCSPLLAGTGTLFSCTFPLLPVREAAFPVFVFLIIFRLLVNWVTASLTDELFEVSACSDRFLQTLLHTNNVTC